MFLKKGILINKVLFLLKIFINMTIKNKKPLTNFYTKKKRGCFVLRDKIIKRINKISITNIDIALLYKNISSKHNVPSPMIFDYINQLSAYTKVLEETIKDVESQKITMTNSNVLHRNFEKMFLQLGNELFEAEKKYIYLQQDIN